jgi:asparagine synthase (glutamine-hydrolysing)
MVEASDYWQPDATSRASNKNNTCHLAKATLFNTALSKKDNVYTDSQTGAIISANARLDNRTQLMQQLNLNKHTVKDGELILNAYQRWGRMSPKYLLGDFAFIIWDEVNQKVFCARDHFGVKLLLYSCTDKGIMISNEPNAFFTSGWLQKQLKESWLVNRLWGLGPTPASTAYDGLDVVPAGHFMEIVAGGMTTEPYWKLTDDKQWKGMSDEELLTELKCRFRHAVEVRLESDYPLASELSEGLDSSGITGYAAMIKPDETIFTLSYECVALTEKTRPVWEKTYEDIFAMLDMHDNLEPIWTEDQVAEEDKTMLISNTGGAFALRGAWLWHCRLAHSKGVRVLLAGWGGDHCVSTYGDFYESELFNKFRWLKVHKLFQDKYKRGRGSHPLKAWICLLIKHLTPRFSRWYVRKHPGLEQALLKRSQYSLLKEHYIARHGLIPELKKFTSRYRGYSTKAHHRRELFEIGLERRLIDSELSARMYRVEFRFPMLDIPLVEFAYNLPSHLKIYRGIERYSFRHILKGVTTERIRWRLKADVYLPDREDRLLSEQERQELQELLHTQLLQKYCHTNTLDLQEREEKFVLNQFRAFSPVFRYYADNNVPVKNA